jgi:hypothetical protein
MAEFHYQRWSMVSGMSWYDKGVEFRRRMDAAGYDLAAGDTWAINELPSSTRGDPAVRRNVRELLRGLYTGPEGGRTARGAVFIIGMGQRTMGFSVYKPELREWLTDADFWTDAGRYARWWAQEVYAAPENTCVGSASIGERAVQLNAYTMHVPRYADAAGAPAGTAAARAYLERAYVPLMNAVWQNAVYRTDGLTLDQMQHFVSLQTYAARAWASSHPYPDGRVGFAWDHALASGAAAERALADRLAAALRHAYDADGGSASRACSPSGAFTWCGCVVPGAAFNTLWEGFDRWP